MGFETYSQNLLGFWLVCFRARFLYRPGRRKTASYHQSNLRSTRTSCKFTTPMTEVVDIGTGQRSGLHSNTAPILRVLTQVHFHIVPAAMRPSADDKAKKPQSSNPLALMGLGHGRQELDDDEAEELCQKIRQAAEQIQREPNSKL